MTIKDGQFTEDLGKASSGQDFQGSDNGEDQGNSAY